MNMNQRPLNGKGMFPRLRVLNGEIVTFQDIDLAEVLYKQRV